MSDYTTKTSYTMDKAQKAVDSVVDGVKKVAIGEKKPKAPKKDKSASKGTRWKLGNEWDSS